MKKLLHKITASIKISDIFRVCGLMAINLVHIYCSMLVLVVVGFGVADGNTILTYIIIATPLTISAGLLIRTLKVWLISLPVQFIVYLAMMMIVLFLDVPCSILGGLEGAGTGILLRLAGIRLLVQIPGVAVGLLIRYLIRKIRARKQATPIA